MCKRGKDKRYAEASTWPPQGKNSRSTRRRSTALLTLALGLATLGAFATFADEPREWISSGGETVCRGTLDVQRTLDDAFDDGEPNKVYFRTEDGEEIARRYLWLSEADRKRVLAALDATTSPQASQASVAKENSDAALDATTSPQASVAKENSDVAWDAEPKAGTRKVLTVGGVDFAFRYCPAGTFQMGSPEDEAERDDGETQHEVTLTRGFWTLETEVTQEMYEALTGENPSWFSSSGDGAEKVAGLDTSRFPVERVSWYDCQIFIAKLNADGCAPVGFEFRLPTEAEWEYACRAGTSTPYFWGSSLNGDQANCCGNYPYGTTKGAYLERTTAVGSYDANPWGLHDMHGNVWEWCADWYDSESYGGDSKTDPTGASSSDERVGRGGSWHNGAIGCRSAQRGSCDPNGPKGRGVLGFRFVLGRQATPASVSNENSDVAWNAVSKAGTRKVLTVDGVEYAFRYCPSGTFTMGSSTGEKGRDDERRHIVMMSGFWMLETEVTLEMWRSFVEATDYKMESPKGYVFNVATSELELDPQYTWENPGFEQTASHPVTLIDYAGAVAFCEWLSRKTNLSLRLPTEAEWEYACRAGSETAYSFGENRDDLAIYGNACDLSVKLKFPDWETGFTDDGYVFTSPARSFKPNAWGLYDMHGNVWEQCADWYASEQYNQGTGAHCNPMGPSSGAYRIIRGGSWFQIPERCRSAKRSTCDPEEPVANVGFRLALDRKVKAAASTEASQANVSNENSDVAWDAAPKAGTRKVLSLDGVEYAFRYCPAGTFQMGSPKDEKKRARDETRHKVTISGYWMLETEVTVAMWRSFCKATKYEYEEREARGFYASTGTFEENACFTWSYPGFEQSESHPVTLIDYTDAVAFCEWLSQEANLPLRLPTEAEWEYACRAGSETTFSFGLNPEDLATYGNVADASLAAKFQNWKTNANGMAIVNDDGYVFTAPARSFKPNAWGLYDMHGNVREWCADWYASEQYETASQINPKGSKTGSRRVYRGGGWGDSPMDTRSAYRGFDLPITRRFDGGFRIALGYKADVSTDLVEDAKAKESVSPEPEMEKEENALLNGARFGGARGSFKVDGVTYHVRYCPSGTLKLQREIRIRSDATLMQKVNFSTDGFFMLETEVTVAMWRSFVRATNYSGPERLGAGVSSKGEFIERNTRFTWDNPTIPQTDAHPVTQVDWDGANAFCAWLAEETGLPIRMPNESEWEYACRAGSHSAYSFGEDDADLPEYGNIRDDSYKRKFNLRWATYWDDGYVFTAPARSFKPNAWGFYDMHGNVSELCENAFSNYFDFEYDTFEVSDEYKTISRGGSWSDLKARADYRNPVEPTWRSCDMGFRFIIAPPIESR